MRAASRQILRAALLALGLVASTCLAALPAGSRIVTLAPSATEMVFAAGGGAAIVATDRYSDYPPQVRGLPRVGDVMQYSDEAIIALAPTMVVGWKPTANTQALAARLARLDVPLIYADPRTMADIPAIVRRLGALLGTGPAADASARALRQRIEALHAPAGPPLKVLIEIGAQPPFAVGNEPLTNDMLQRCGGRNIYGDARIATVQLSIEDVLQRNPDVLIVSPYGGETLAQRRAWWAGYGLRAALDGRVHAIDPDWLHRPGPRLVDAAEALCADLDASRAAARTLRPQDK